MSWRAVVFGLTALGVITGCGAPPSMSDGGDDAGVDAGRPDAAADAGAADAGGVDGGGLDGGDADAGLHDAGYADAGEVDAGTPDSGAPDAGFDAGVRPDAGPDGCLLSTGVGAPFRVRAVAANLTSGNLQSWDPGHGQRILQGLQPDVILIQEFNYGANTPAEVRGFVDAVCGTRCSYVRGATGSIPNGVISRWPIVASGDWADPRVGNRAFTWAHIDLPGPRDLWAVSLHLLTGNAGERNLEAQSLIARLDANIPAEDFLLVGGDLNTDSRTESCIATLGQRTVTAGPHPEDQDGVTGTNASRSKPYDWVLASRCLQKNQVPVEIGAQQFDAGLVFDSRVYTPLTDVPPVLQSDSAAPQMQHMAVVKDFLVQP
ncbi:MAG: endonuclease/exonuclease/phosphatase family protein [Myxococcota bacterium]